jgi:hypothetical protein
MIADTTTASRVGKAAQGDLVQLTDEEIDGVSGGIWELVALAVAMALVAYFGRKVVIKLPS